MSHRFKHGKRSAKPDVPLAKDTLAIAQNELKGAKALYDSRVYPSAIFSLQQSMEKGWKSFGFYYGIINEDDARSRDIGHKGSRVCNKTIRTLQRLVSRLRSNIRKMRDFCNIQLKEKESDNDVLADLESSIVQASTELTKYSSDDAKFRNISIAELESIIRDLILVNRAVEITENILNSSDFTKEHYCQIRQGAFEIGLSVFRGFPQAEEILKKACFDDFTDEKIKKIIYNTIRGMSIINPLLYLALITQAHEQSTRYTIDGKSPIQIYTQSHPLIQKFPELYSIAEKTLKNLESFYESLPTGGTPS